MDMTSTDIIEVMKACRDLGVRHFEGNGLKLEFGPSADAKPVLGEADPAQSERILSEVELRIKQEQLENLKIEDPFAYEELIAKDLGRSPL